MNEGTLYQREKLDKLLQAPPKSTGSMSNFQKERVRQRARQIRLLISKERKTHTVGKEEWEKHTHTHTKAYKEQKTVNLSNLPTFEICGKAFLRPGNLQRRKDNKECKRMQGHPKKYFIKI